MRQLTKSLIFILLSSLALGEGTETLKIGTMTHNVLQPLTINWTGTTLDFTGATVTGIGGGGSVDDTAFASSWNGVTTTAPSKNAVYDWGHLFDTDDDGKVNVLDQAAGIALTDASGVLQSPITDNSSNWNTAFTDRLKWDGGATGLTAATGRTSLGATTVGSNIFTLTNPSAVSFPRINADNTVTARSPADVQVDLSLVVGTDVQAWDADLDTWATKTPYAGTVVVTTGKTFTDTNDLTLSGTDGSTLNIGTGGTLGTAAYTASSAYQPIDTQLTDIAALSYSGNALQVIRVNSGQTAFELATIPSQVNNTAFAASWDAQTSTAPSKNAVYDWGHTFDTDDDGKVNVLDLAAAELVKTDSSGVVSNAAAGTDYLAPSAIDDTAFASSWNGVTTTAASKNSVYDWGHTFDSDDDGKVNVLDLSTAEIVKTNSSGVVASAAAGTDYEVPLTFSTGLTRSTNTITVNTSQNIAKLSNLTSNGFVKTGSGDGTLSVDTSTYLTSTSIDDTAYDATTWNGDTTHAPSKNAVRDKIETMGGGSVDDTAFASSWNGVTTTAPSKNAVYDWGHTFDTDDDGLVNKLDTGDGLVKVASNVASAATAGTDYLSTQAKRSVGFTLANGGNPIATGKVPGFFTVPYAGTITGYNFTADAGTCTVKTWKIATGTAKPTSANSISTSGVQLSSGTAVHSSTTSDFTSTAVTANDIIAFNIEAVSGVADLSFSIEITPTNQ